MERYVSLMFGGVTKKPSKVKLGQGREESCGGVQKKHLLSVSARFTGPLGSNMHPTPP